MKMCPNVNVASINQLISNLTDIYHDNIWILDRVTSIQPYVDYMVTDYDEIEHLSELVSHCRNANYHIDEYRQCLYRAACNLLQSITSNNHDDPMLYTEFDILFAVVNQDVRELCTTCCHANLSTYVQRFTDHRILMLILSAVFDDPDVDIDAVKDIYRYIEFVTKIYLTLYEFSYPTI